MADSVFPFLGAIEEVLVWGLADAKTKFMLCVKFILSVHPRKMCSWGKSAGSRGQRVIKPHRPRRETAGPGQAVGTEQDPGIAWQHTCFSPEQDGDAHPTQGGGKC